MVNLIAGRAVVPELMQGQMTGARIAEEALRLLPDGPARREMQAGLAEVRGKLSPDAAKIPLAGLPRLCRKYWRKQLLMFVSAFASC